LTVVPAIFGAVAIVAVLATTSIPPELGSRAARRLAGHERLANWVSLIAGWAPTLAEGVRGALQLAPALDPALIGAFCWWAFDIGVLWACFEAFGKPPAGGVVVMAYLTGMLGNVLPLPGGLGGVEGAMIGAFLGFGASARGWP
jgi:uncharacterized membrane protein YbhN (UPF0104 family)